jgi:hypothetical protein
MLLVILALACVATVPLAGGNLTRLRDLDLRRTWAVLTAITIQLSITTIFPNGDQTLYSALHLLSYGMAALFLISNRTFPGLWILTVGGALNLIVISANHGVMPASATATATAGIPTAKDGFANSAVLPHPRLSTFGDVIGIPGPWPLGNTLSVGDLLIFAGLLVLLHRACRQPRRSAAHSPA